MTKIEPLEPIGLRRFLSEMRRLVRRNLREGDLTKLSDELDALLSRFGGSARDRGRIIGQATDEFVRARLIGIDAAVAEEFKDVESGLPREIRRIIAKSDNPARALSRLADVKEHHLDTVVRTGESAIRTLQTIADAHNAGVTTFRYEGPSSNIRSFCSLHLGRVYSIAEIEQMTNGHGLPVLSYRGGYNCRHRWVAVAPGAISAEKGAKPGSRELLVGEMFSRNGYIVVHLKESNVSGMQTPDMKVDGVLAELKTITGDTKDGNESERVRKDLRVARDQGAKQAIVYAEKQGVGNQIRSGVERFINRHGNPFEKIFIIDNNRIEEY